MADLNQRETPRYHYGEVITPFHRQGQQWDWSLGYWRQMAVSWRKGFFYCCGLATLLSLLLILLLQGPQHRVMAVSITKQGFSTNVGALNHHYQVPLSLKQSFLKHYVSALFSKVSPKKRNELNNAFASRFSNNQAQMQYQTYLEKQLPSQYTYPVSVLSVVLVGHNHFKVRWRRSAVEKKTGKTAHSTVYEGAFVLSRAGEVNPRYVQQNPFGLRVETMSVEPISKKGRYEHK